MGFSLIAATAIIGVTIFIAVDILLGGLTPAVQNITDSYKELKNRMIEQIHTNINITNLSLIENGSANDYNLTIKNTGSVTLKTTDFHVLINGTTYTHRCSQTYLYPDDLVYFLIDNIPTSEAKRFKVITPNGVTDYYE